jgi:hypothetical protein
MSEWQPIETAPKDGTHIILFWPYVTDEGHVTSGYWYLPGEGEIAGWHSWDVNGYATPPTHWMPLPAPPLDLTGERT